MFSNYGKMLLFIFLIHMAKKISLWNKSFFLVLSFTFIRRGSRNTAASNMKLFVTIVDCWKLPTTVICNSILDVAWVLNSSIKFITKCELLTTIINHAKPLTIVKKSSFLYVPGFVGLALFKDTIKACFY